MEKLANVIFPRVHHFGRIQKRICDLRSFGSWCIKGTDKSLSRVDSSVPLMHHNPNDLRSQIRFWILPKKRTRSLHPHLSPPPHPMVTNTRNTVSLKTMLQNKSLQNIPLMPRHYKQFQLFPRVQTPLTAHLLDHQVLTHGLP